MDIRISIRHLQLFDIAGRAIVYNGPNPQSLKSVPGNVPQTSWIDVTDEVANRDKITISFSADTSTDNVATPGPAQPKKTITNSLLIEGAAYAFIKAWCIDHVAAPLNRIDVKIEDTSCGEYLDFSIKASQIEWCESGICQFDVTLKQTDLQLLCIQKTLIGDNHKGWFQEEPQGGKKHPRFSYCNEIRPNSTLVIMWYMIRSFADIVFMIYGALYPIMLSIALIVNSIVFIINFINSILGTGTTSYVNPPSPRGIADYFRTLYVESAGCGREHPAPLIRDYIQNVCDKCGVQVDAVTAPIFFAQNITLQASTRVLNSVHNPHYNACYLTAQLERGVRRIRNNSFFHGPVFNNTSFYLPDNAPIETLDMMLDKLKTVYNAKWRVTGGKLYFWRKDWFEDAGYLYDFTENGADRIKILEGVCFEWNEVKYPAYVKGLYSGDAADTCGNEALRQMNGYATYGDKDINPNYEGVLDKTTPHFGGTKFRLDAASTDYIFDAFQFLANGQAVAPTTVFQLKDVATWMQQYADYALLMKDETCTLPKILIWDGREFENAKCIRDVVPINNYLVPADPTPQVNPDFNAQSYPGGIPNYEAWTQRHPVENHVVGSAWVPGGVPVGIYECSDYFGSLIYHAAARLVNYPMYFEPGYLDTLFDWFHWIDSPSHNPVLNLNWNVKIDLCCEDLEKLEVLNDGQKAKLLHKVKLPLQYYPDGIIKGIDIAYDPAHVLGRHIVLKGGPR